jgi:hypothetical protein
VAAEQKRKSVRKKQSYRLGCFRVPQRGTVPKKRLNSWSEANPWYPGERLRCFEARLLANE